MAKYYNLARMDGSSMVCHGCSCSLRTTRRHIVPPRVRRPSDAGARSNSYPAKGFLEFLEPTLEQNPNGVSTSFPWLSNHFAFFA